MLGAVIGDIVGSPYEFDSLREIAHSKNFPLVTNHSYATDDTVMTIAVADALMSTMSKRGDKIQDEKFEANVIKSMRSFGARYPYAGYGTRFWNWLFDDNPKPYGSYGNGSAMRVSPVAWAFDTLEDVEHYSEISARVTHNHPEGIKGAQATAAAIFLARTGHSKLEIKNYVTERYNYDLTRTLDKIRPNYRHVESCQETVPEAITAFLEGESFEDCARCAVSLSGDSDTLTAITCSIAEGFYNIPEDIIAMVLPKLDEFQTDKILQFDLWRL